MRAPRTQSSPATFGGTAAPSGPAIRTSVPASGAPTVSRRIRSGSVGAVCSTAPQVSVMPKVMDSRAPNTDSTRSTNAGVTVMPPVKSTRSADRSVRGRSGWATSRSSSVGAADSRVAPRSAMARSTGAGAKGSTTCSARAQSAPTAPSTLPAVWNSGIGFTQTRPAPAPRRSAKARPVTTMPAWVICTPLARPVVPEVNWICARLSGSTTGSAEGSASSIDSRQSFPHLRISRSRGSRSAASAARSATGFPPASTAA